MTISTEDVGLFREWANTGFAGIDHPDDLQIWLKSRGIAEISIPTTILFCMLSHSFFEEEKVRDLLNAMES